MFAAARTAPSDTVDLDSIRDVRSQGEMIFDPMRMFSQASPHLWLAISIPWLSALTAVCVDFTLTLTGVTQCPSQPRPGPAQLILNRISAPSIRGCHQTNQCLAEIFELFKYSNSKYWIVNSGIQYLCLVHFRNLNIFDIRKKNFIVTLNYSFTIRTIWIVWTK